MNVLRVVGLLVAALILVLVVRRRRRRTLRLADTVIMTVLALALGTVSILPSGVAPLLRVLGFPPGNARRVIGLLVLSNILMYVLLLRAFAKTDRLEQT